MMTLVLVTLLGMANFALHSAVLDSRHPVLGALPPGAGRLTLSVEFAILLAALLAAGNGYPGWRLAYLGYSALNGTAAWLILTGRI